MLQHYFVIPGTDQEVTIEQLVCGIQRLTDDVNRVACMYFSSLIISFKCSYFVSSHGTMIVHVTI